MLSEYNKSFDSGRQARALSVVGFLFLSAMIDYYLHYLTSYKSFILLQKGGACRLLQ